jgi:hypothetical protein
MQRRKTGGETAKLGKAGGYLVFCTKINDTTGSWTRNFSPAIFPNKGYDFGMRMILPVSFK